MNTKSASVILGLVFIAVGILGFVSNPIIGESANAIFHADTTHNAVHIASGVLFLIFGLAIPNAAPSFLKVFGVIYLLLGVLGLITIGTTGMGKLLGLLHVNGPDNILHIVLGIVVFLAGSIPAKPKVATYR